MSPQPIAFDELLCELGIDPSAEDDGWYTAAEYADRWGVGIGRARTLLKKAQGAGRLDHRPGVRIGLDGRKGRVPTYRVKPASPAKKAKRS